MKELVIIGAGGFGRELFSAAREAVGFGEQFRVKGYLDANPAALDRFAGYPPILGSPEDYTPGPDDVFITALGNIASRKRCVGMIEGRGGAFISVIHRSASLGQNVTVALDAIRTSSTARRSDTTRPSATSRTSIRSARSAGTCG